MTLGQLLYFTEPVTSEHAIRVILCVFNFFEGLKEIIVTP